MTARIQNTLACLATTVEEVSLFNHFTETQETQCHTTAVQVLSNLSLSAVKTPLEPERVQESTTSPRRSPRTPRPFYQTDFYDTNRIDLE